MCRRIILELMKNIIDRNFLLTTDVARRLYHDVASICPVIDYHCHLDVVAIAEDRRFENLYELWIEGDPYKHRAMRILGVPEEEITGAADPMTKFKRWAESIPQLVGNPLFDWSAMELHRYFGITEMLSPDSAERIWNHCRECLQTAEFSARGLLRKGEIEVVCTSDLLGDDLSIHEELRQSSLGFRILPSLRDASHVDEERFRVFESLGCVIADHAVSSPDGLDGLDVLAEAYAKRGWSMQLHLGALRKTSSRLREIAGASGGYAGIAAGFDPCSVSRFLDQLEARGALPNTVIYPLNPGDYAAYATLTGSFTQSGVRGKIQLGPAWWWNDHRRGMREHLDCLASYGVLSSFLGMTTDSRSLLSMVRHEYFRRVLCEWIGEQVVAGTMPDEWVVLEPLVRRLSYGNAKQFLKL